LLPKNLVCFKRLYPTNIFTKLFDIQSIKGEMEVYESIVNDIIDMKVSSI